MRSSRQPIVDLPHPRLRARLDALSSKIPDPVHKLWFIKRTLAGFEEKPESLRRLPVLRGILFHYSALEALGELIWRPQPATVTLPRGPIWALYRLRHVLLVFAIVVVGYASFHAGAYGYGKAQQGADWFFAKLIPVPEFDTALAPGTYPTQRVGELPARVWLVEEDDEEELWSNGLRIITTYEGSGDPRSFFAFPKDGGPPAARSDKPVGIVYHTTESDMAPLDPQFNRNILETTRDLMGWLSRREIYNYVVDRFGLVYRIIPDDEVAIHAGVSIWSDDENYYLNLNESFVGVAFESQWRAGLEVMTPAQLQAAVNLTDYLRVRYDIPDQNCVPHGTVSVNATKRLIGYHADWARGFPFAALGLSDKYRLPPPSMTAFGFGYDDDLVERLDGELWPGVEAAESSLAARAKVEGVSLTQLRLRLHQRYLEDIQVVKRGAPRASAR